MIEFGRTHWENNWSGAINSLSGGLVGFTQHVNLSRHCPLFCKPGLWHVALNCGSEILCMLNPSGTWLSSYSAVMDDFGNLVKVEA